MMVQLTDGGGVIGLKLIFPIIPHLSSECIVDIKCNYFLISQLKDFEEFINNKNYDLKKIKILTALIWINMAPLHEYPLNNFLFNFGKFNRCN